MKIKYGKMSLELLITAVLSAIILSLVNYVIGLVTFEGMFYSFLMAIVSVVFFIFAMKINPGKEEFLTSIPIVIMSLAIVELLRNWLTIIPALSLEFTWASLAFGLGSVFLASAITKKYILK